MSTTTVKARPAPLAAAPVLELAGPLRTSRLALRPLALLVGSALALPLAAAEFDLQPTLSLRETWTDNVTLTPDAISERVTEVNPGLRLTSIGPRHRLVGDFQWFAYSFARNKDLALERRSRQASAHLDAVLAPELLTLAASIDQSPHSVTPFGPTLVRPLYSNNNRADVRTFSVAPTLHQRWSSFATAQLMLRHHRTESGLANFIDRQANSAQAQVASGPAFSRVGWRLALSHDATDFESRTDTTSDNANLELRYRLTPTLTPTMEVGYERYDFAAGIGQRGRSWNLGLDWAPGTRTHVKASAGRRFFGSAYHVDASHRSRATVWRLGYQETIDTARNPTMLPAGDTASLFDQLLKSRLPDPATRAGAVEELMRGAGLPANLGSATEFLSNRYFLSKNLNLSMAYQFSRLTATVDVFASRRRALESSGIDALLYGSQADAMNNTRQGGANARLRWTLGPRTDVSLALETRRTRSLSTDISTDQRALRLGGTRKLGRHVSASVEARRTSGTQFLMGGRYRENALAVGLTVQL